MGLAIPPQGVDSIDIFSTCANDICTKLFIMALFVPEKREKIKFLSETVWLNKLWHIHAMESHGTLKKESGKACSLQAALAVIISNLQQVKKKMQNCEKAHFYKY